MIQFKTLVLGDYETNCYLVWAEGSQECVVIDPGYEPAVDDKKLEELCRAAIEADPRAAEGFLSGKEKAL